LGCGFLNRLKYTINALPYCSLGDEKHSFTDAAANGRLTARYEDIDLRDYRTVGELKAGVGKYFAFYNGERFHESLGYETADTIYFGKFLEQHLKDAA
jgi:putative transposase